MTNITNKDFWHNCGREAYIFRKYSEYIEFYILRKRSKIRSAFEYITIKMINFMGVLDDLLYYLKENDMIDNEVSTDTFYEPIVEIFEGLDEQIINQEQNIINLIKNKNIINQEQNIFILNTVLRLEKLLNILEENNVEKLFTDVKDLKWQHTTYKKIFKNYREKIEFLKLTFTPISISINV